MNRGVKILKKMMMSVLTFSIMLVFSACGDKVGDESGTFLSLKKDEIGRAHV